MPACRLCLLATGLLLGLLLFTPLSATGLSEGKLSRTATGTTTLSAGLARTSPLSRGQVSTKPPVVTKEGGNGEKQGTCPSVDFPKLGLCEDQCQMDSQCSGNMKCCRNGCGKMGCTTPKF
ncbi:WAP four-disulfide core domain 2, isoform CRA_b [Rattus norvegicus]|uniref:WAP four-disulfide core domain 2, isoform CRA_b n=2 Tax=Rattus norvegicus TaxID=10116 RepID=A6JX97_RAT|nr:WAP four-disulfide core domain protein 2 isoform X2 [Rattus norvegicus]EDL96512.1 WAP four-disulfide core domain 2, isoform CRA_b [Rattus norvegicus]CAD56203.1 epididymal secretory protein 4 [Rattus norvegicus]